MFVLALILALQGAFIGGHMVKSDVHHGIQAGQVYVENVLIDEGGSASELHRSLAFYPSSLDFGAWAVGTAKSHIVTLVNKNTNRSVYLSSISGKTPAFYSSFFEDKVVPPQGNTTFNVVFLPRNYGEVETNLLIHTSFGQAKLPVKGEGKQCPYRLRPLVGIKAPFNATVNPEIVMYNPHARPIQILEVYSSGGQFQLELPSGGQEGPQALWEIPPYASKPIIRIKFHGSQPGNHTAYIRIKISGIDENHEEDVLVIPVEFEILSTHGIYSPSPVIDFGRITTNDVKQIKVNLTNSGKGKIEIIDYRLKNVNNLVELRRSDLTLVLNANQVTGNINVDGELLIKTQAKQQGNQYLELSVGIRAEIFKGSLQFQKNLTVFITGAKNYTKTPREFYVKNAFSVPVAISNLSVGDNDTKVFKIEKFNPTILSPGQKISLFTISAVNESANFITPMTIETNLTSYEFPVIVCTGLLKRYTSIDSDNLTRLPDENVLDFGVVPFGDFSHFAFIILKNPNPISIQFMEWNFTNPPGVYYHSTFLGCLKPADSTGAKPKIIQDRFNLCLNLSSEDTAAYGLSVQSFNVKSFNAIFKVWTEIEEIVTTVKFVTVMGRLEVDQSRLHFSDCFPGKRCSADISIHSTFLKTMRVNSITVSVPGLVFEYHTQNGLPEIAPNAITDIGRIHFDPKSVCLKQCYLPQEGDIEAPKRIGLYFDESELRRRTDMFRRFKWTLQIITFTLNTSEVRLFEFNTTVDIVWPKLVKGVQALPPIEVGQSYDGLIYINNPSPRPLMIELSLSDPKKARTTSLSLPLEVVEICVFCYLTDEDVFVLDERRNHVIKPNSLIAVGVRFIAQNVGIYSTLLHIKNNLTLYEAVWVTAKAVQPQFRFGNRKPGSQTPLLFEINERHLTSCDEEENRHTREMVLLSTKRTFTARNTGEVPILVETFQIGDRNCEGYGFKILDCSSFELKANSSKKIDIAFTPDFTATRISRPLILLTNLSYIVNYTLLATVPPTSIEQCAKSLQRPYWEAHIKKASVGVLAVAFLFVLVAAFLDADKVLKDHVQNMSKEKGPLQPPLDLRNIAMKATTNYDEAPAPSNGVANSEKISVKNSSVTLPIKKRNSKRNSFTTQIVPNRDKSWADELAKKLRASPKNSDNSVNTTNSMQISSPQPTCKNPVNTNNNRIKEEKQTPPKKENRKESTDLTPEKVVHVEKPTIVETEKKSELKSETIQQIEMKKPKLAFKKTKPSPVPINAAFQAEAPKEPDLNTSPTSILNNEVKCPPERPVKLPKTPKEKIEPPERKVTPPEKKTDIIPEKKVEPVEKKSIPVQTEPTKPATPILVEIPTQTEPQQPVVKISTNQRKYGKTPGRERKKEQGQPKRSERKIPKFKGNAFQFSAPLQTSSTSSTSNVWDLNQASFSHVVAQKSPDVVEPPLTNGNSVVAESKEPKITEHDWNEADLKNDETFGPDAEEPKRGSFDLGPIGTRKSPSSTPVWEPLPAPPQRPTPSISSSSNSSFFSSNFPIASNFEYSTDNQYLGGASGLLDHLISESQQQRRWQTNDVLLSLLQRREQTNTLTQPAADWQSDNRTWTPMGYQNDSGSLISEQRNGWPSVNSVRPPPGLGTSRPGTPNSHHQNPSIGLNHDDQIEPIQPFDPFSSLSSIWSETWTKKNNQK